jgi:phosphoglycolate phosphatase-like HAD superfamily hydrolase
VAAAVEKAGGGSAVMLGDSTWDCKAAERAGVPTVGILTGGFSEQELRDAGAGRVVRELRQLIEDLDDTPFGGR